MLLYRITAKKEEGGANIFVMHVWKRKAKDIFFEAIFFNVKKIEWEEEWEFSLKVMR